MAPICARKDTTATITNRRVPMKKILLAIVIGGALGLGAWVAYQQYFSISAQVAPEVKALEHALASNELLALASFDVAQAVALEERYQGKPSEPMLANPASHEEGTDAWLSRLQAAGIDPRRQLSQVVAALYVGEAGDFYQALVLYGNFDAAALSSHLRSEFKPMEKASARPGILLLQREDKDSCELSKPWAVHVSANRIVISDPDHIDGLLRRVNQPAVSERSMGRWDSYRQGKLVTLALFIPEQIPEGVAHPMLRMPAEGAKNVLQDFHTAYFAIGMRPLPAKLSLSLLLEGDDPQAIQQTAQQWRDVLATSKAELPQEIPSVRAMVEALKISSDKKEMMLRADMDRGFVEQLQQLPNELLRLFLGGLDQSLAKDDSAAVPPEKIDENPLAFSTQYSLTDLPAYDATLPSSGRADVTSGPFGLRLNAIALSPDPDASLELEIGAKGTHLVNLGNSDKRVSMKILQITDQSGANILRQESCGRDRNGLAVYLASHFQQALEAKKTVRLRAGVKPEDIKAISGVIRLHQPLRTETVLLSAPTPGTQVERNGVRLDIREVDGGTVSYQVTGKQQNLLHVRALNANKQALSRQGSSSSSLMFGAGRSESVEYAGMVAYVEVVFALEEQTKDFPFNFSTLRPGTDGEHTTARSAEFRPMSLAQIKRRYRSAPAIPSDKKAIATAKAGPFMLIAEELRSFIQLYTRLELLAPVMPNMVNNLSALRIQLQELELKDGSKYAAPQKEGVSWLQPLELNQYTGNDYLSDSISLDIGIKAAAEEVASLRGKLILRVPQALATLSLETVMVGQGAKGEGLEVVISKLARDNITLSVADPDQGDKIMAVKAFNKEGKELWVPFSEVKYQDGAWQGSFKINGIAERIDIIYATKLQQTDYPFSFKPVLAAATGQ